MKAYYRDILDRQVKQDICDAGENLCRRGFVMANDGNISARVSENEIWITPTMVSKGSLNPEMLIRMDLDGNVLNRTEFRPSSESGMHLRVYRENPEVNAVVHAHPAYATAYSTMGADVENDFFTEPMFFLGDVIRIAPFAIPGSAAVSESIAPFCRDYDVVLLGNHGALTWGESLKMASFRMESLEHFCQIATIVRYTAKCNNPIEQEALKSLREVRDVITGKGKNKAEDHAG